jgi:hypothetical protein
MLNQSKATRKNIFRSAQEIMDAYDMTRGAFETYRKIGMPMRLISGSWHARRTNIDEFFRKITAYSAKDLERPEGAN